MLRQPEPYRSCLTDFFSRAEEYRPTWEPALWRFALETQQWEVIPTVVGLGTVTGRAVEQSWFLSPDVRSSREDRYAFLPCVPIWLSPARPLLHSLGVTTIEEAPLERLIGALHQLANQISGLSAASLRHVDALANDLYGELQARLKSGASPKVLSRLADRPVPLLYDDVIQAADLSKISGVFVDDDPIRRNYLKRCRHAWFLPKRFRQTYSELVDALRVALSPKEVLRVSECPLEVPFQAAEETRLLDYLEHCFTGHMIRVDLGLLIVKCGRACDIAARGNLRANLAAPRIDPPRARNIFGRRGEYPVLRCATCRRPLFHGRGDGSACRDRRRSMANSGAVLSTCMARLCPGARRRTDGRFLPGRGRHCRGKNRG